VFFVVKLQFASKIKAYHEEHEGEALEITVTVFTNAPFYPGLIE